VRPGGSIRGEEWNSGWASEEAAREGGGREPQRRVPCFPILEEKKLNILRKFYNKNNDTWTVVTKTG
jgi:hypothetical protein